MSYRHRRAYKPGAYKAELSKYNVHTKSGKEAFIHEVAKAFKRQYPAKYRFITNAIRELNKCVVDSRTAKYGHDRHLYLEIRVPTELMLFIQRWIPEFGRDSEDIVLLKKCWPDLATKDWRKRTRMTVKLRTPEELHPRPRKETAHVDEGSEQREAQELEEGQEEPAAHGV